MSLESMINDENLSLVDYLQLRLENIQRNETFLSTLGLSQLKLPQQNYQTKPNLINSNKSINQKKKSSLKYIVNEVNGIRKSKRLQHIPCDDTIESMNSPMQKKQKQIHSKEMFKSIDFDEESNREHITATSLRRFIEDKSQEDSNTISDEAITHCVFRMNTMSNKRLATRIQMIARNRGKQSHEKLLVFYYALELSNLKYLADITKQFI